MIENNADMPKKLTKKTVLNEILDVLETVFISAFLITMFFTFVLRMATVKGESMLPTLYPDERILVYSWDTDYSLGDIIVIDCQESVVFSDEGQLEYRNGLGKQIIKRVIATEGQVLDIDFEKGLVYVDGKPLNEPYVTGLTHFDEGAFTGKYPFKIPEGFVFVLGDNRGISRDSRDMSIGLVSVDSVIGKAVMRISPVKKFGLIS
ncbi:MAG: signal peptidase I [Ruminococcus sp.]|nr:signal peptidase I [Ruminococcus sp.]